MMMFCGNSLHAPLSIFSSPRLQLSSSSSSRFSISCSQMDTHNNHKFLELPFVSAPHKNLMLDLVSTLEDRLQSHLLPCSLPSDVQYYKTNTGTSEISLHITPGNTHSPVIFLLLKFPNCDFLFSLCYLLIKIIINLIISVKEK